MSDRHTPVYKIFGRLVRTVAILLLLHSAGALGAVEDNTVLSLDPQEGLAVVETLSGELEVIAVGDTFPGSDAVVVQVLADRVVAEEVIDGDRQVTQQVWIFKAKNSEAKSRVERLLLNLPRQDSQTPVYIDQTVISIAPDSQGASE